MNATQASNPGLLNADGAGLIASVACAIHCAAMPLVIGYLPMLGLSWLANESFHQVMAAVCFVLAASAFWPGWRKHGSLAPALIGTAGVALLAFAAFGLECECCPTIADSSEASSSAPACVDENCPHCLAAATDAETPETASGPVGDAPVVTEPAIATIDATSETAPPALAWAIPLITPLGGILLVAGHLVNHRKSCKCTGSGCCLGEATVSLEA